MSILLEDAPQMIDAVPNTSVLGQMKPFGWSGAHISLRDKV